MANDNPESLLEKAKFFREHVQTILNLAAGSFVLSVTFLHDIAPKTQHADYLRRSWFFFLVTILVGLLYNYVLSIYVSVSAKSYGTFLWIISAIFHLSFVVAIYYLFRFGIANL